jgi:hypothetical protein
MYEDRDTADELRELLAALREDVITDAQAERLTALLRDNAEARRTYIRYMAIAAYFRGGTTGAGLADQRGTAATDGELPVVAASLPLGADGFSRFPPALAPWSGFALSYAAAAVIVGIGLLVGWACQVSAPQIERREFVGKSARPAAPPLLVEAEKTFVGRITGMVDCRWADPHNAPVGFDRIPAGRKCALLSGLLEITYDAGAKVILEGPCDYTVNSKTGGYLALGKATARVDKKAKGEGGKREQRESHRSDCFFVRTPTATVTDLGTEFGVEVDTSGASRAQVFQGKVELRVNDRNATAAKVVSLSENQSARVDVGGNPVVAVSGERDRAGEFVREMPRRERIKLFNTGVNLKMGEADPHWQVVTRSDQPNFKPRQAVVTEAGCSMWLANQSDRSQWISLLGGDSVVPNGVVCTFRTTFELNGVRLATAILHGWFAVDNHIGAIRLNGHDMPVPKHGREEFGRFHSFSVERGFVEGVNVLEFDVENWVERQAAMRPSPMGLLVELEGSVLSTWPGAAAKVSHLKRVTER